MKTWDKHVIDFTNTFTATLFQVILNLMVIILPLPNAVKVYGATVVTDGMFSATLFAIGIECSLFIFAEIAVYFYDLWREGKTTKAYFWIAQGIAIAVLAIIMIVVWNIETGAWYMSLLPLISAFAAVGSALMRGSKRNLVNEVSKFVTENLPVSENEKEQVSITSETVTNMEIKNTEVVETISEIVETESVEKSEKKITKTKNKKSETELENWEKDLNPKMRSNIWNVIETVEKNPILNATAYANASGKSVSTASEHFKKAVDLNLISMNGNGTYQSYRKPHTN